MLAAVLFLAVPLLIAAEDADDQIEVEEPIVEETETEQEEEQEQQQQPPQQQPPPQFIHPLTNMPDASEDVKVSSFFVSHPENEFPSGDDINCLVGFRNEGDEPFRLIGVMGSINYGYDFSVYLQNFTFAPFNATIPGGQEITFPYEFTPDWSLEPMQYQVGLSVFYEDAMRNYSSTFFNSTFQIVEAEGAMDSKTFFSYVGGGGLALIVAYMYMFKFRGSRKPKKSSAPVKGNSNSDGSNEYVMANVRAGSKKRSSGKKLR